ncbi:MAG TPA: T6SS immunity protein Tdi1 domain-containing protein [Gemmataceae bacterium]|jgi:hypothetical protein
MLSWSWVLSGALRVLAQNSFGNLLVELADGSIWRVCPEDLDTSKVAESENELAELWAALERLEKGQCYGFKIWPVLGGTYEVENMAIKSMMEWLAVSGDAARQIRDLPPGPQVRLDIRDA